MGACSARQDRTPSLRLVFFLLARPWPPVAMVGGRMAAQSRSQSAWRMARSVLLRHGSMLFLFSTILWCGHRPTRGLNIDGVDGSLRECRDGIGEALFPSPQLPLLSFLLVSAFGGNHGGG